MVAAPPALDVAVGASMVAVTVGAAVAVSLEAVLALPQAASANTSASPKADKTRRIGDPFPHERLRQPQQAAAEQRNP